MLSWCKSPLNGTHVNDPTLIYTTGEISFLGLSAHLSFENQ